MPPREVTREHFARLKLIEIPLLYIVQDLETGRMYTTSEKFDSGVVACRLFSKGHAKKMALFRTVPSPGRAMRYIGRFIHEFGCEPDPKHCWEKATAGTGESEEGDDDA